MTRGETLQGLFAPPGPFRLLGGLDLARVVMESTGVYSNAVQRALAEAGVEVWVVNARHVTRVPGRKTDVSDSQWLATLARYGLVNPSFVAPRNSHGTPQVSIWPACPTVSTIPHGRIPVGAGRSSPSGVRNRPVARRWTPKSVVVPASGSVGSVGGC